MKQYIDVKNIYLNSTLTRYLISVKSSLILLTILINFSVMDSEAFPLGACPTNSFLFKNGISQTNLDKEDYQLIEKSSGINANIYGLGFDQKTRYLYGFNTINLKLVRMNSNYAIQTLNLVGLPKSTAFYVGSVSKHYYYLYRKGVGLYKVDLSPLDHDLTAQLKAELVGNISDINLTDMAFNPNDNKLYGVDNKSGYLYQISTNTGIPHYIGESGGVEILNTTHFDAEGYFYLLRNQDNKIYKIDLSTLVIGTSIETLLALNESEEGYSNIHLNTALCAITGDSTSFVTVYETGLNSVFSIYASREGRLNLWFDWNRDGDFDDKGEKTLTDIELQAGSNVLSLHVPKGSYSGSRWSSFSFNQ